MINFIKLGSTGLDIANDVIENQKNAHAIDDVILKAPIDKPNKILAVGLITKNTSMKQKNSKITTVMMFNCKTNSLIFLINKIHL